MGLESSCEEAIRESLLESLKSQESTEREVHP